jgi:hypothetical protein
MKKTSGEPAASRRIIATAACALPSGERRVEEWAGIVARMWSMVSTRTP